MEVRLWASWPLIFSSSPPSPPSYNERVVGQLGKAKRLFRPRWREDKTDYRELKGYILPDKTRTHNTWKILFKSQVMKSKILLEQFNFFKKREAYQTWKLRHKRITSQLKFYLVHLSSLSVSLMCLLKESKSCDELANHKREFDSTTELTWQKIFEISSRSRLTW